MNCSPKINFTKYIISLRKSNDNPDKTPIDNRTEKRKCNRIKKTIRGMIKPLYIFAAKDTAYDCRRMLHRGILPVYVLCAEIETEIFYY